MQQPPDLLSLIPEGPAKRAVEFGLKQNLTIKELKGVFYDAGQLCAAMDLLLSGAVVSDTDEAIETESR